MKQTMETAIHMNVNTEKVQTTSFGDYTITKDFEKFTVLITKPSARSRMGIKYVHHVHFRSYNELSKRIFRMTEFVKNFVEKETAKQLLKEAKQQLLKDARKSFKCPYEVGQIFYNSWGYDQTNIDFYQLVAIKGKTLTLREISQTREGYDTGTCKAVKDSFVGEEFTKVIQVCLGQDDKPLYYISADHGTYSPWDGKEKYWSSNR